MATETMKKQNQAPEDRPSGVPGPHQLGASRREGFYVVLALVVLAAIAFGFWFEATR